MTINVWGYLEEMQAEKVETIEAIEAVLSSGRLILGNHVQEFEESFSKWCGVSHGVGVANGTDAIFLGLKALDIKPGDEVITVSNTAVPTVSAIVASGGIPKFVDIDPDTYLMDISKLESSISPKTKFIVVVHLYGQCVDMTPLMQMSQKYGLKVFEDCAQAHGAEHHGQKAGSFGDAASFSFYPTKILGTYGDGGMVITNSETIRDNLKKLRFYGMTGTYFSEEDGYNSRLDELHAAILLKKFNHLETYLSTRKKWAKIYDEVLPHTSLKLPTTLSNNSHAYYLYVVAHPERDLIIKELKKKDINLNISYPWPIHTMPPYKKFATDSTKLPHTEKCAQEIFSLPMYPSLKEEEVNQVCAALAEITGNI